MYDSGNSFAEGYAIGRDSAGSNGGSNGGFGGWGGDGAWQKSATLHGDVYRIIAVLNRKAETLTRTEGYAKRSQGQSIGGEKI